MARPLSRAARAERLRSVADRPDVLGLGIIPFDILYTIDSYPGAGSKIDAVDFHTQGGGPVPNALVGLARLGYRTALIAAVGTDVFGTLLVEEMGREKVDRRFVVVKDRPTAIATGYIERGSGRRTMVLYRDITVDPADIKTKRLPVPRLVHLDGRDMPATMKLARWAKTRGVLVSFDIGSMRNDVSAVFPLVDHLVVADSYALPFTGCRSARAAIAKLRRNCAGTIVVTEGIKGAIGFEAGGYVFQQAYRVKNVDTTGAGDAFHAGYLGALLEGMDLPERLRYGAAVAALKCRRPGGRLGLPTRPQVRRFLASNPRTYA
jgi:sulfofructose kinase